MVIRARWMLLLVVTALALAHQGAARAQQAAEPLYWELDDTRDPMTDRVTRSVGSDAVFEDGRLVQVSAVCDDLGIQFSFDAFRGGEGIAFAWRRSEDETVVGLRVRIDAGTIRTAVATHALANEATIAFYDPSALVVAAALPSGPGRRSTAGQLLGGLSEVMSGATLAEFDRRVAGNLAELNTAQSLRVELPLADGTNSAVLIDLTEPVLSAYVHQCVANGRASNGR
jgi:hypothetical protein